MQYLLLRYVYMRCHPHRTLRTDLFCANSTGYDQGSFRVLPLLYRLPLLKSTLFRLFLHRRNDGRFVLNPPIASLLYLD